jgi:acyl-CoA synthetase (AMP-forming)/AMP-acid ligase II
MIYRSPKPDVEIPDVALTPFLLEHARKHGDKPALVDGTDGRTMTFSEFADRVESVAGNLARRGVGKGDVFAIYSPNCPEFPVVFHAVSLLGGTVTTVNPLYTEDELAHQLADACAQYLFTIPHFAAKAIQAAGHCGIREVFVLGEVPAVAIDPHVDVVALPYSSGTTGLPKGVMLTHRNLVANMLQTEPLNIAMEHDTVLCVLPMFHIYGLNVIMNTGLFRGTTIVTLPRFDLEQFLRVLQDHAVTVGYFVPPIVLALAKHPVVERYDISKLRTIMSGAAPLGPELQRACAERLGCEVLQGYGMTETSPVTHTAFGFQDVVPLGSIGPCIPNTLCRIVDPLTGADLAPGQEGEICVSGPQVMKGYLNHPEATASTIDADGWIHTGDIGYADENGNFFVVDRVKELIKYKGMQVAPAEIEAVLVTHPAVADAAVIPKPDDEAGEVPKAFVVLKGEVTQEALMAFVADQVAPHKKVREIEFVPEIPKSASGKILRRVLVDRERARRQGA